MSKTPKSATQTARKRRTNRQVIYDCRPRVETLSYLTESGKRRLAEQYSRESRKAIRAAVANEALARGEKYESEEMALYARS